MSKPKTIRVREDDRELKILLDQCNSFDEVGFLARSSMAVQQEGLQHYQIHYVERGINKLGIGVREHILRLLGIDELSIEYYRDHYIHADELGLLMVKGGSYKELGHGVIEKDD